MTALRAVCVRALYARGVCVCAGPSPRVAPTRVWTKGERLCAPALVRRTYNTVFKWMHIHTGTHTSQEAVTITGT